MLNPLPRITLALSAATLTQLTRDVRLMLDQVEMALPVLDTHVHLLLLLWRAEHDVFADEVYLDDDHCVPVHEAGYERVCAALAERQALEQERADLRALLVALERYCGGTGDVGITDAPTTATQEAQQASREEIERWGLAYVALLHESLKEAKAGGCDLSQLRRELAEAPLRLARLVA